MDEPWYIRAEREAANRVAEELAKPYDDRMTDEGEFFNPWSLFPGLYGTYSAAFDICAVAVLQTLLDKNFDRDRSLGAEMLREMLCNASLCSYGTSPRVCFPTSAFTPLIPQLIERWKEDYRIRWEEPFPEASPSPPSS